MARFELSITADYAPSWGVWEGIREVIQNGLDSRDMGYPLTVEHKNGALHVTNEGCVLDTSVWLLGKSSKRFNDSQRGQHGDGLKVGTLALVRAGVEVKIFNGDEIWTPVLEESKDYAGETVLAVKTRKRRTRKRRADYWGDRPESDFTVTVKISKADWRDLQDRFLDLTRIPASDKAHTYRGTVLLDPKMIGRVYSKGIYVCTNPDLQYGYDFVSLELDRDRRMVSNWDLQWEIAYVMSELCKEGAEGSDLWIQRIYETLSKDNAIDFDKIGSSSSNETIHNAMAATFASTHGEKAVPVANDEEATKVSFYGLRGVVVPQAMGKVLAKTFGDLDEILSKAIDASGSYVNLPDMDPQERVNWRKAINLCEFADIADRDYLHNRVRCYEYSAPDAPLGTHHNGEERINRCLLGNLRKLVSVIVHELAHNAGRDGTLEHRQSEEAMFEAVMGVLLDMAGTDWLLD